MRRNSPAHTDPRPGRNSGEDTMANKTQTITKPAAKTAAKTAAKPAAKPAAKTTAKPVAKTATSGASIVAMIVEGIAKRIESPYYKTAIAYHARNKTQFPRARNNETRAALKVEDVAQVFEMHDKKILASGNAKGQAMFDVYMMAKS